MRKTTKETFSGEIFFSDHYKQYIAYLGKGPTASYGSGAMRTIGQFNTFHEACDFIKKSVPKNGTLAGIASTQERKRILFVSQSASLDADVQYSRCQEWNFPIESTMDDLDKATLNGKIPHFIAWSDTPLETIKRRLVQVVEERMSFA